MNILSAQKIFSTRLCRFVLLLNSRNYEITFGEIWRSDETARLYEKLGKGISKSLHRQRLAADLNLFKAGKWLTEPEEYEEAGELWKQMSSEYLTHFWGGDFKKVDPATGELKPAPDAYHFSIGWEGIK